MEHAIHRAPEIAGQMATRPVDVAPDGNAIGYFAAIILEHLIAEHGPILIDRVEDHARDNPKFVLALRGMHRMDEMRDDVWERVEKITSEMGP